MRCAKRCLPMVLMLFVPLSALGIHGCRSAEGQGGLLGGSGPSTAADSPAERAQIGTGPVQLDTIDSPEALASALERLGLAPTTMGLPALVEGALWELPPLGGRPAGALGLFLALETSADARRLRDALEGQAELWVGSDLPTPTLIAATGDTGAARSLLCRLRARTPVQPPRHADGWVLSEEPGRYDTETIFNLIDGAAETHIRYHMLSMLRATYTRDTEVAAHADIFAMESSEDAYGLLTRLGRGEPIAIGQAALGGGRSISVWQGPFYVEVSAATRKRGDVAELDALARAVAASLGPDGPRPPLVEALGDLCSDVRELRYFHERADQESFYYLSTANVLHLGTDTDGVMVRLEGGADGPVGLVVRYPDAPTAAAARDSLTQLLRGTSGLDAGPWPWEQGTFADLRLIEGETPVLVAVFAVQAANEVGGWMAALSEAAS